jgi:hypothetical protein
LAKQIIILIHVLLLAFAVIPKSYLHDCHQQHEIAIEKQKVHFSDSCHICDNFFAQTYDFKPFYFVFSTFKIVEINLFKEPKITFQNSCVLPTSRGPPSLA